MSMLKRWVWLTCLLALAMAGCDFGHPTPKPIVTGRMEAPVVVKRATYETSAITEPVSTVVPSAYAERPAPPIIRPFAEWSEQEVAADALGRIGPPAIPYLQQSLRSPDPAAKIQAAEVLARMGSDAKPAVNDLVILLDDPNPEVRRVAARTLGRIGPDAAPAIPALMRSLVQPEPIPPPAPGPLPPAVDPRLLPRE